MLFLIISWEGGGVGYDDILAPFRIEPPARQGGPARFSLLAGCPEGVHIGRKRSDETEALACHRVG